MRVAIITFESKGLAELAITNSLTSLFKGLPLFTEAPNEHSIVIKRVLENFNKKFH
jgi:hypothetical protein